MIHSSSKSPVPGGVTLPVQRFFFILEGGLKIALSLPVDTRYRFMASDTPALYFSAISLADPSAPAAVPERGESVRQPHLPDGLRTTSWMISGHPRAPEPDLDFRRVDIDVDRLGGHVDEQGTGGVSAFQGGSGRCP